MHKTNSNHEFNTSQKHNNNHHDLTHKKFVLFVTNTKKVRKKHPANGTTSVARRTKQTCLMLSYLPYSNNRPNVVRPFLSITPTNLKHALHSKPTNTELTTDIDRVTPRRIYSTRAKTTTIIYLIHSYASNRKEEGLCKREMDISTKKFFQHMRT